MCQHSQGAHKFKATQRAETILIDYAAATELQGTVPT